MMKTSHRLKEPEESGINAASGRVGSVFRWRRILLTDLLPVGILLIACIGFSLAGAAIFLKLERDEAENTQQDHTIESFGRSFEYTMTLITTIGYGHITPTGQAAKLATVFYGAVGIPLFLATMFKIGSILASIVVGLFTLCGQKSKNEKYMPIDGDKSSILGDLFGMMTGILLFIIYLVATTFLVRHQFGDWHGELDPTFIDAFYFNFVTLSTTGFGDVLPNMSALFYTYLIIGLAIVFMNIILVKTFVESVCQILRKEFKRELR